MIPHLNLFISLLGAVASTFLALIFPPLCHMAVVGGDAGYGRYRWRLVMNGLTLTLGAVGFVTGTYASVYEICGVFQRTTGVVAATAATAVTAATAATITDGNNNNYTAITRTAN